MRGRAAPASSMTGSAAGWSRQVKGPAPEEASERHMPRASPPLNSGSGELVDIERFPKKLQQAYLLRTDGKISSGDFHRQRIAGLAQMIGKRVLHKAEHGIKPAFFLEDRRTFLCHRNKPLFVEITKGGQGPYNGADIAQLAVAHGAINGAHRHHDVDQGIFWGDGRHGLSFGAWPEL